MGAPQPADLGLTAGSPTSGGAASSVSDVVYREVKSQILSHRMPGGSLISEGAVAKSLGISRTPVREGFIRLEAEGWLTLYPKRGALIREFGPEEARDVIEARIVIESHAACRAIEAKHQAELAEGLQEIFLRQSEACRKNDQNEFIQTDIEFHQYLVASTHNKILTDLFATLRERQVRMTTKSLSKSQERCKEILKHHQEIIHDIDNGDMESLLRNLQGHLRVIHQDLLK